ncbi:hypothetical protein JCM12296A_52280 [Desulfosarcina cetonica]|uniref:metallophosphoesterase n=1 Tax=Desulfosarcina cetonica TaxID=90730 RepID=UPI0006D2C721|nr:metallophosphoesterase [Desulfosarcina cetonica]
MLRIAHLSDFHLSSDNLFDAENFTIRALIKDLEEIHSVKQIDLIVFSGDLIDKGGESFENSADLAFLTFEEKIIKPILECLNLGSDRFLFCPGNHDIVRSEDEKYEEDGLCAMLNCTEEVNSFIESKKDGGIKRILKYKEFEKVFHNKYPYEHSITNYQSVFKTNINTLNIGISCLNTCWRCYDSRSDRGKILLGERQLLDSRKIIEDCDLKIAILHHPIEWLADFDFKSIREIFQRDYNLVFTGHSHQGDSWVNTNYYGGLFVSVAPSNWTFNIRNTDENYYNGYSVIDYDVFNGRIEVRNRKYYHKKEKFGPDVSLGDDNGIAAFLIPNPYQLTRIYEETQIVTILVDVYFDSINEHLLSYNTDTKAPKRIDDLFVHPKLSVRINSEEREEDEYYTIEQILASDENIIIYGTKESGKTILLDKFFLELTKDLYKYKKIPVCYDFQVMSGKKIETIISRFLHISIHSVHEFLKDHKVVLLIDNISFNESDRIDLNKLMKVTKDCPSTQIIATSNQIVDGAIPISHLSFDFYKSFKTIRIQSFKTKEIKQLIRLWFSNNEAFESPVKFEKIIELFSTLNLPRTPLAISMFLWIIEQQENYRPINQAVMLENFIERLFKKQSKKEIYSDQFDYTNKQRLLSEIAKEMLDKELPNYRIPYHELINFIYDYLKNLRFDFLSDGVLKHFLTIGILIIEVENSETYVRFRFTCFFQYFLMKYMEYESTFLEYVIHEDNFLFFINEIDYFTGIKRDQSDILKIIVERMNNEFKEILALIDDCEYSFDEAFMGQKPIIKSISNDIINELPEKRPNEKEIEEVTDKFLETIKPEKGIKYKRHEISPIRRLEIHWSLAAKILKNTEETKLPGLKDESYNQIIRCSLAFASLYKYYLERYFENNKDKENTDENLFISKDFIPLLNQMALFTLIGTQKLNAVIRDKIRKDLRNENRCDMELFTSVFIYSDLKGPDYQNFLNILIKESKQSYIFDMILFKIVSYYFFRSNDKETDKFFLNLIGDLLVKAKGEKKIVRGKIIEKYRDKGKIIQYYKKRKQKKLKENYENDIV